MYRVRGPKSFINQPLKIIYNHEAQTLLELDVSRVGHVSYPTPTGHRHLQLH